MDTDRNIDHQTMDKANELTFEFVEMLASSSSWMLGQQTTIYARVRVDPCAIPGLVVRYIV